MKYPDTRMLVLPLAALLVLASCENTRKGAEQDAKNASKQASQQADKLSADMQRGADKVEAATNEAVSDVKEGAEKAAEATSDALDEAGQRTAAAGKTLDVKTALMADKSVNASRINVDSEFATKVIHLRGAVSTQAEKAAAEAIAVTKADGWRVSNELTVSPP